MVKESSTSKGIGESNPKKNKKKMSYPFLNSCHPWVQNFYSHVDNSTQKSMYRGAIPQSPSRWDHTDSIKLDSSHGLTRGPPIVFHQLTSVMTIVYRADATYSGTCTLLMCRKLKRRNLKSQKRQFSIIQAWGVSGVWIMRRSASYRWSDMGRFISMGPRSTVEIWENRLFRRYW